MSADLVITATVALLGGGGLGALLKTILEHRRGDLALILQTYRADFARLHEANKTLRQENAQITAELRWLRQDVDALVGEVHRLGGDASSVRPSRSKAPKPKHRQPPKEQPS